MREFFRGWRRKTGCVTLLVACLLTGGWVRSLTRHDGINYRTGQQSDQRLISFQSAVHWCWLEGSADLHLFPTIDWYSFPHATNLMVNHPQRTWRWSYAGFGMHDFTYAGNATFTVLVIPYWSIVLPLIVLSAWLLFSKSRPQKEERSSR